MYPESAPALPIQKRKITEGQAYCGTSQGRKRNRPPHCIRLLLLSDKRWNHPTKNGTSAETKVGCLVCGGQHNAPQIDSYFTTTQTALNVTEKEHIKEPQQLSEWIQNEPDNCRTRDNQLDDFLQILVRNPKTGQYTASLPWTLECDKSKIPTNRHIAYHRARNMIEKMSTDKQLFQKLKDIFGDYQRRGFISLTTNYNRTTTTTSAAICPGMPSTKITPFTPKLGLSLTPVAATNDWECHSTIFSGKDPI